MAKNVKINGVTYANVPEVRIPLATGTGNAVFYDTAEATVLANDLMAGKTAYGPSGVVTGTLSVPTISQDTSTKVLTIS